MAPRKGTSSGGKKLGNQNREQQQLSQSSKFVIHHFLERHSQNQKTLSQKIKKRNNRNQQNPISDFTSSPIQTPHIVPKPHTNVKPGMIWIMQKWEGMTSSEKVVSMGKFLRGEPPKYNFATNGVSENAEPGRMR